MLNPIRIYGTWDEGIVLDNHMLKSVFLGYDNRGREKFENTRTEIGELIYKYKYKNSADSLIKIINLIKDIIEKWDLKRKIDMVIPVPPSNKMRSYQPVFEIAKEIANFLDKDCRLDILLKEDDLQAKDNFNVEGRFKQIVKINQPANVLIVDDLYSTGATLNEVCKILREDRNVMKIYVLAITKTKR